MKMFQTLLYGLFVALFIVITHDVKDANKNKRDEDFHKKVVQQRKEIEKMEQDWINGKYK